MQDLEVNLAELDSIEVLSKCLTRKRSEILRTIVKKNMSLGEISRYLGVNRSFLSETIQTFQAIGLITIDRVGKKKIPRVVVDSVIIRLKNPL